MSRLWSMRTALCGVVLLGWVLSAFGQTPVVVRWLARTEDGRILFQERDSSAALPDVRADIVRRLAGEGYLQPKLIESRREGAGIWFEEWLAGPRTAEVRLRFTGSGAALADSLWTQPEGERLGADASLEVLAGRLAAAGHPLATLAVDDYELTSQVLTLDIRVEPGPGGGVSSLRLPGARRTQAAHVYRVLRDDDLLVAPIDPGRVRTRLVEEDLFAAVDTPSVEEMDGRLRLVIPVQERAPGQFDLALGYDPGAGGLIGSGRLALANPFGRGRGFAAEIERLPGQSARADAELVLPYLPLLPLGGEARFAGRQQDTLYSTWRAEAGLRFRASSRMRIGLIGGRESTEPGAAGSRLAEGQQRIARAEAWYAAVTLEYDGRDSRRMPTSGVHLSLRAERRDESGSERRLVAGDTLRVSWDLPEERIIAALRWFVPAAWPHILLLGADGAYVRSDELDASDLFRFGGAGSLRGYDEEQYLGRTLARLFAEYRVPTGGETFIFAFGDLGWVDRPALAGAAGLQRWLPGFGLGARLRTAVGRLDLSIATNPDELASPRLHAALAFDL